VIVTAIGDDVTVPPFGLIEATYGGGHVMVQTKGFGWLGMTLSPVWAERPRDMPAKDTETATTNAIHERIGTRLRRRRRAQELVDEVGQPRWNCAGNANDFLMRD
jgi:hypothetical protein